MSEGEKNFFEKLADQAENPKPISREEFLKEASGAVGSATIFSAFFNACTRLEEESKEGFSSQEKKQILDFSEKLRENEKRELQIRFIDYKNAYKIYNNLEKDDTTKDEDLFYKFYSIFYKYCPDFSYKEEAFLDGSSRAFVEELGSDKYQISYIKKDVQDSQESLQNKKIFNYRIYQITHPEKYVNSSYETNLKELIAELSHLVDFYFNPKNNNVRVNSKINEFSVIESYFPEFEMLGYSGQDLNIRIRIKDLIRYFHIEFNEFYTHEVEERAIWSYLLDVLPGKSLEEIRGIYILIFEKVKNHYSFEKDETGHFTKYSEASSRFAKAAIYSALSMPELVKEIVNQKMRPDKYIDFILMGFDALKQEILDKEIDVDPNYLFFELLNCTVKKEEIESILHIEGLIKEANRALSQNSLDEGEFNQFSEPKKILVAILAKGVLYTDIDTPGYIKKYQEIGNFGRIDDFLKKENKLLLKYLGRK